VTGARSSAAMHAELDALAATDSATAAAVCALHDVVDAALARGTFTRRHLHTLADELAVFTPARDGGHRIVSARGSSTPAVHGALDAIREVVDDALARGTLTADHLRSLEHDVIAFVPSPNER
jgi:hypothetical protein